MLEVRQRIRYMILASVPEEGCVQWVTTHDWSYPRMVKYTTDGSRLHAVVRFTAAGELLPAKWPPGDTGNGNIKARTVQDNSIISKNAFDVLVVNEACSLLWVDYDASSGNSMPPGAVVGGHLADKTPLHVAVIFVGEHYHVIGYYNHVSKVGICDYATRVTINQIVKILIVP